MIFSRELINKNIKFHDCGLGEIKHYDYVHLSRLVDAYKNLFVKKGATKGRTIVIGTQASIEQIALVLACSELGMNIVVVGNPFPIVGHEQQVVKSNYIPGVISEQYRKLLPVDFFVVKNHNCTDKFEAFKDTCRLTIIIDNEILDYTPNEKIAATDNSALLKCSATSDGKISYLEHTQEFVSALSKRNAKYYYGSMGMLTNLAHGSSAFTFFFPALVSEQVTDFYNFSWSQTHGLGFYAKQGIVLNHVMFPYTDLIQEFFNSDYSLNECVIYTLGLIRKEWIEKLPNKARDIISIFGSARTSGPTLISQASDPDFAENTYKALDDFFGLSINKHEQLEVTMPVTGTVINTGDKFVKSGNNYIHGGKSDISRINDLTIDSSAYQNVLNKLMRAELVVDTLKNRIYLAIWDSTVNEKAVKEFDEILKRDSNNLHYISRYESLNYQGFLRRNNTLDKEKVKDYFRSKFD